MNYLSELRSLSNDVQSAIYGETKKPLFEIIDSLVQSTHLHTLIIELTGNKYDYQSEEYGTQYDFNSAIWSALYHLLKAPGDLSRQYIELILSIVPKAKLFAYELHTITKVHGDYFIEQIWNEVEEISLNEESNRNSLHYDNLFLTYPVLAQLAEFNPQRSIHFLKNIAHHWDIQWQVHAAKALIKFTDEKADSYLRLSEMVDHQFDHPYFSTDDCLDIIGPYMTYKANTEWNSHESIAPFENHLATTARNFNCPKINHWLANKYQGSSWTQLHIELKNGWEFSFSRKPYSENTDFTIPGHDKGRDEMVPTSVEQSEWTHSALASAKYGCNWELNFCIRDEQHLQIFLSELKYMGTENWSETSVPDISV